jgi:hypothetical protein
VWPIWIGLRTIALLRDVDPRGAGERVKVSRGEVYGLMARSVLAVRSDARLTGQFERLRAAASRR